MTDGVLAESRIDKRLRYLERIASNAASNLCASLKKILSADVAIDISKPALVALNAAYWQMVDGFKKENGFRDGERINPAKRAAITVAAIFLSPHAFYRVQGQLADHANHQDIFRLLLAAAVIEDFLCLPPRTLKAEQKHDLLVCVKRYLTAAGRKEDAFVHMLCLFMDAMWSSCGRPHSDDVD